MPYKIIKVRNGYKVAKATNIRKTFSKHALTYKDALAQMRAIIISEKRSQKSKKKTRKKNGKGKST